MELAETANIITLGRPITLNYDKATKVMSFTAGAGLELVRFARDVEVVWNKNIVGDIRNFFGDTCGAKKAYERAERRRSPKYLRTMEEANMYLGELKKLLDILADARIDQNANLTTSKVMKVQFTCDGLKSSGGTQYEKCTVNTDLNFLLNSKSVAKLIPSGEGSTSEQSILELLDQNFIISLGPDCEHDRCQYSNPGLGMTAYFIPNQEKEDMYLNFNNVRVFSAPSISTKQDKIVRARAQDGKYYEHSLSSISGSSDGKSINYAQINRLANNPSCTTQLRSACSGVSNIGEFCSQTAGAMLKPQCCGLCQVYNEHASETSQSIASMVDSSRFIDYHIATCFKGQSPGIEINGQVNSEYQARCGANLVSLDGVFLKNGESTFIEDEAETGPFFAAGDLEKDSISNPKEGTIFDDKEAVLETGPMKGVAFRAGKRMDGVFRYLSDNSVIYNGGICGNSPEENPGLSYMLKDNEYFTKLTTCYCKKPYGAVRVTRLCGVRFTTNQNNQLSINMGQGSQYDYSRNTCYDFSKEGSAIVALHGMYKDGGEMTYLAPYYASHVLSITN